MVVVNDCFRIAPWADALVALDTDWWERHGRAVGEQFEGEIFSPDPDVRDKFGAVFVPSTIRAGLSLSWDVAHFGADSGQWAIQIAVLHGARRILLLGYDMGDGPSGERHWFGDHPAGLRNSSPYELFLEKYATLPAWCAEHGVEIINCTRRSRLDCFPRSALRECL